jgi:pimeloyl-ACP methyl ester carboxylesterase
VGEDAELRTSPGLRVGVVPTFPYTSAMKTDLNTPIPGNTQDKLSPAPYTQRYFDAGGVKLHYLDYGTEGLPPMLCVHGGGAHAHWYDYIAPGFTSDYHVRAIDLQGHGDSDWVDPPAYTYVDFAANVDAMVRQLDLRDFVLVGHSMGGAVSLVYAANHPGRVKALIIVDTTVNLSPERIAAMRDVGSRTGRRYDTQEEMVAKFRLRPGSSNAAPAVLRHIAVLSGRQQADGSWSHKFDRNVYGTREVNDLRPNWDRIKIPLLLVKGAQSERISPAVFQDVKSRCPQAELVEVSASDHHVTLDNPREFIAKVKPFLTRMR